MRIDALTNSSYIKLTFNFVYLHVTYAVPRMACFYARRALELPVLWLFQAEAGRDGKLQMPF
jgi:hypothetical protein